MPLRSTRPEASATDVVVHGVVLEVGEVFGATALTVDRIDGRAHA